MNRENKIIYLKDELELGWDLVPMYPFEGNQSHIVRL